MKQKNIISNVILSLLLTLSANCGAFISARPWLIAPLILSTVLCVSLAGVAGKSVPTARLRALNYGKNLLVTFYAALVPTAAFQLYLAFALIPSRYVDFIVSASVCMIVLSLVFWIGIITVYCTSVQLGVRIRVIGLLCGLIFPLNLVALYKIIYTCKNEVYFESDKISLDNSRAGERVCATKYPVLLVHGVFFRDFKFPPYWGRIPAELERNGATVFYGNHSSALSVADSAAELTARIKEILAATGADKVNVIAHSKGGLDCRYALSHGAGDLIASLTTINTPHRGCGFADYLLEKAPASLKSGIERAYNAAAKRVGDPAPDFMAAVTDLTAARCAALDRELKAPDGVLCQSVGSLLKKPTGGKFPLNFTFSLVKYFDGPNDGLVSADSFAWGDYRFVTPSGKRGVSHGDMIDLNRENIPGFDVRELYVGIVSDLKNKGL